MESLRETGSLTVPGVSLPLRRYWWAFECVEAQIWVRYCSELLNYLVEVYSSLMENGGVPEKKNVENLRGCYRNVRA